MGVVHNPGGAYAKELARWNTPKRFGGEGPNGFEEFPKMLYKAQVRANGQAVCLAPAVSPYGWRDAAEYDRACLEAEQFTRTCQLIVQNGDEQDRARSQGWANSPTDAMKVYQASLDALSTAAAEERHRVARMGEVAQREFDAADAATHAHIADVPAPVRRPGRPKKAV